MTNGQDIYEPTREDAIQAAARIWQMGGDETVADLAEPLAIALRYLILRDLPEASREAEETAENIKDAVRPLIESCTYIEPDCEDCEAYYTYDPSTYARALTAVGEARSEPPQEESTAEGEEVCAECGLRRSSTIHHEVKPDDECWQGGCHPFRTPESPAPLCSKCGGLGVIYGDGLPQVCECERDVPESPASGLKPFPFDDPTKIISKERPSAAEIAEHLARQESPASEPEEWERVDETSDSRLVEVAVWQQNRPGWTDIRFVPIAVEDEIGRRFALEQYDLLKARAERAEERATQLETALRGWILACDTSACPHGNSARYPSSAWFCDDCVEAARDALAESRQTAPQQGGEA